MAETARDAHHLHHILNSLFSKTIGVHHLVGNRQLVIKHIQMAHRGMHIHGFHRITTREVNTVKILRELQKILTHLARARHLFTQRHVPIVGRGRDIAKEKMFATHSNLTIRISRGNVELAGG